MTHEELQEKEYVDKKVAFYQTFLGAWVASRMEADKQLLTLSSLAIGLLMIFYDKLGNVMEFVFWVASGAAFVLTITLILFVYRGNSAYIERVVKDCSVDQAEKMRLEKTLSIETSCAFILFVVGVVLTFALAIMKSGFMLTKTAGG